MNEYKQIVKTHKDQMARLQELVKSSYKIEVKECVECGYFAPCKCGLK